MMWTGIKAEVKNRENFKVITEDVRTLRTAQRGLKAPKLRYRDRIVFSDNRFWTFTITIHILQEIFRFKCLTALSCLLWSPLTSRYYNRI